MNKKVLIGLGVLAVAGIGIYMWRKKQGEVSETETKVAGKTETTSEATPEVKASAVGVTNLASNAGKFPVSPRFSPSRFSPSRNVASNKVDVLDTLTRTNIGNVDVVSPRVAVESVGVGTVDGNLGGNITPTIVGKVKFHSIWNTKPRCPNPQTAMQMTDGSWACTTPIN